MCLFVQGRCTRDNCKYLHPPPHLKTQLEINGRNNLIQQKAAAAMLAQQMQFMLPGAQLQPIVSHVYFVMSRHTELWVFLYNDVFRVHTCVNYFVSVVS